MDTRNVSKPSDYKPRSGIMSKFSFILACLSGVGRRRLGQGQLGFHWAVPDGGWGWVVAFGAAAINIFYTAGSLAFGIIFKDLTEYMHTSGSVAGWVIGLYYFTNNVAGPLVLSFAVRYTYRLASIVGAILAFIGFFLSSFANSIGILFFTYGIIAGLGIAFALSTSLCVVYPYFDKRKGIATAITLTGFPMGRFIMAPLLQFLNNEYGFKGLLLIVSAIVLNIGVAGLTFHPVSQHMKLVADTEPSPVAQHQKDTQEDESEEENENYKYPNGNNRPALTTQNSIVNPEVQKFVLERRQSETSHISIRSALRGSVPEMSSTFVINIKAANNPHVNEEIEDEEDANMEMREKTRNGNIFSRGLKRTRRILFGGIQFSIMKDPVFYIFLLNAFLTISLVTYVYIFLVPLAKSKGLGDGEVDLLMLSTAIGECAGRMSMPALMDLRLIPGRWIIVASSGISATLLWGLVLANSFASTIIICTLLGFVSGGHVGGSFFVIVEVIGTGMLPSCTGLTQFCQAFYTLAVGPIIGWAKDVTGTFDTCYLIVSGVAYLTMIGWLLLPLAQRAQRNPTNREDSYPEKA